MARIAKGKGTRFVPSFMAGSRNPSDMPLQDVGSGGGLAFAGKWRSIGAIEQYLQEISGSAASAVGMARDYAQHASDQVCAGYAKADRLVRDRPLQSLLVSFGVGWITGAMVALLLCSR